MKAFEKLTTLILIAFTLALCTAGCNMPTTPTEEVTSSTEPSAAATELTTEPTAEPTVEPTAEPTVEPTTEPTAEPTAEPTTEPTAEPTVEPAPEATTTPMTPDTTTYPVVQFVSKTEENGWTYVRYQIKLDQNAEFLDFGYKFTSVGYAFYLDRDSTDLCGFVVPVQILSDSDFNVWGAIYDGNTLLNGYQYDYQSLYGSETGGAPSNIWITHPDKFIYDNGYGQGALETFPSYRSGNHNHTVKLTLLDSSNNSLDIVFTETLSFEYEKFTNTSDASNAFNEAKRELLGWNG